MIGAYTLLAPFLVLLMVAGVLPFSYAIIKSLQAKGGGFAGFENFQTIVSDFRFEQSFRNVGITALWFLPLIVLAAVGLAILAHASSPRLSASMRFVFYIPGAFAGMANFVLWLYVLDPTVSPISGAWNSLGWDTLGAVVQPGHLPQILTVMLLFQGLGAWLLIIYGGLNSISEEVMEAAAIDGANAFRRAWHIQIPILRPWIGYLILMNTAYVLQLFLEPALLAQATNGKISPDWTPNQLSFTYAFGILNEQAAAAMSVILLMITLTIGMVIVTRTKLFGDPQ